MKLDYIDHINDYGENMVRLYDFDMGQATQFRKDLQEHILSGHKHLDLSKLTYIKSRNCNLTLRIAEEDEGISTTDKQNFFCDLTLNSYREMDKLIEPFCLRETKGHQWLYDVDTLTDFLFSPGGTW